LNQSNKIVKNLKEELILLEPQQIEGNKIDKALIVVLDERRKL